MKFNTAIKEQKAEAFRYFMRLANKHQVIEVKKVSPGRTLSQNSYLHLLIGYLAAELGEEDPSAVVPPELIKDVYKMVNKSIYYREHELFGVRFKSPRSSADLSVDEMTQTIDNFRKWSAEQGYPLPAATDKAWLIEIENTIEQSRWH